MYKKISEMPKEWPLARKGRKYIAVSSHNDSESIPIVFALRDVLKIAKTKREVKKICMDKNVKVNGRVRVDIAFPIQYRDILQIEKIGKTYILVRKNKRFQFEEIKNNSAKNKVVKIRGKKILGKGRVQANLQDGGNFLIKESFSCGDSAVVDFEKNSITKIIPLKTGAKVEIIKGKHIGSEGKIVQEKGEGKSMAYEVKMEDGRTATLHNDVLLAVE